MAGSNFPNGFMGGVTIRGVPIQQLYPGQVFWVNNSSVLGVNQHAGSDQQSGIYTHPVATVDTAISRCTASRGDIIVIMPGHNEGSSTANAEVFDLNKAGIAVIGPCLIKICIGLDHSGL